MIKENRIIKLLKADLRGILRNPRWLLISVLLIVLLSLISLFFIFEENYFQFAYFYIPPFLTIFASTFVAGERKSGFISHVFTSPVTKRDYSIEKFLLGLSLGFIYLLFTLPFSLLHLFYSGWGFLPLFLKYLLSAILLITFSSALGIFISVFSNKDDVLAILLGFVFCVVSLWFFSMFTGEVIKSLGSIPPHHLPWQLVYIYHFSPYVCILDFLNTHYAFQAGNPYISLFVIVFFVLIFLGFSYLIFKKLQNVKGNGFGVAEVPIVILLILCLFIPPMLGNSSYSAREINPMENSPWRFNIIGGGSGIYLESFGKTKTVWWGKPVKILIPASHVNVKKLHRVTVTFLSGIEHWGNQSFVEFEPTYFEELEVKKLHNDSYVSFPASLDLPSTKVGDKMYYMVMSVSSDEYNIDLLYGSVNIYNGKSVVSLFITTLLLVALLLWVFLREKKVQRIRN